MYIIGWIKDSLVVSLDEYQSLFDLKQVLDILDVLLVDTRTEPDHESDRCDYPHDVIESVYISDQVKVRFDEIEILKRQNDSIEQISSHEGRRIDHNSCHILFPQIHDTEPKNKPRLQALSINQIYGWKYSQLWIIVPLLWIKNSPTGLYHHFSSLKIDQSYHDKQKVQKIQKKTHYEF